MHYSTTARCRTARRQGNNVFELNYFNLASTIGVEDWYDNTNDVGDNKQDNLHVNTMHNKYLGH